MLPQLRCAAKISYRESGRRDAPALVLLHGIGSNSAAWRLQYAPLGKRLRVVAWDAPGYGSSQPLPGASPGVFDYAQALGRLLDALGIKRAVLGANSWGTCTAVGFACLYPQRVRGLVLGGPAAGAGAKSPEERAKLAQARIERIARLGPEGMRSADVARLLAPSARAELQQWVRSADGLSVEGYSQAARMLAEADVVRDIAAVCCPVIVVSGEQDRATPPAEHARRIAAAARRARFESLPDCGHLPHLEHAERFNTIVLELACSHDP